MKLTYTLQIYRGRDTLFRWRLVASNGQVIAASGESFVSKASAQRAARNLAARAGGAAMDTQQ